MYNPSTNAKVIPHYDSLVLPSSTWSPKTTGAVLKGLALAHATIFLCYGDSCWIRVVVPKSLVDALRDGSENLRNTAQDIKY